MIDYEKYLNKSIREIPLSPIEKVSLLAKEVGNCIVLGVGEPDFTVENPRGRNSGTGKRQNLVQPGSWPAAIEKSYM